MSSTSKRHEYFRRPMPGHDVHHGGHNADPRKTLETACRTHLGWYETISAPNAYEPVGKQLAFGVIMPSDLSVDDLQVAVGTLRAQRASIEQAKVDAIETARAEFEEWQTDAVAVAQAAVALLTEHGGNAVLAELLPAAQKKLAEAQSARFRKSDVQVDKEPGSVELVLAALEREHAAQSQAKSKRIAELRALLAEAGAQLA